MVTTHLLRLFGTLGIDLKLESIKLLDMLQKFGSFDKYLLTFKVLRLPEEINQCQPVSSRSCSENDFAPLNLVELLFASCNHLLRELKWLISMNIR